MLAIGLVDPSANWPRRTRSIPGDDRCLAIPVPIPNTVVKQPPPMIVRKRESRSLPGFPSTLGSAGGAFFCALNFIRRGLEGDSKTDSSR